MSATQFTELRIANKPHLCTLCDTEIGSGEEYKREAVPPWAMHSKDEEGHWVDYGDGRWFVIEKCYLCRGAA